MSLVVGEVNFRGVNNKNGCVGVIVKKLCVAVCEGVQVFDINGAFEFQTAPEHRCRRVPAPADNNEVWLGRVCGGLLCIC